jgi:hypothetical protein
LGRATPTSSAGLRMMTGEARLDMVRFRIVFSA